MAKVNEAITINIYDDDDKVVKTAEAQIISLRFGVVRSLMEIMNIENVDNTADLLKTIYGAWDEIKNILCKIFPGVALEELDNTHLDELVPVVLKVVRDSFNVLSSIPTDEKN